MKRTFGQQPTSAPPSTFREVHFTKLMLLDQGTREQRLSRVFESAGAGVRELPRTISMQYLDDEGHIRSAPVGALHEVTIDGDAGLMSGKGWLADTPDGHLSEVLIVSQALQHNSADLGDVPNDGLKVELSGEPWEEDFKVTVRFKTFNLSKTTLVANPAFADMKASLPDEITAALGQPGPLIVDVDCAVPLDSALEITASAMSLPRWDDFHRPESDIPHKIIVGTKDAGGWIPVYGHLGQWNKPHLGYDGRPVYIPRPTNNYSEWNQPSVLTDRGQVEAGPIVLYGGHVSLKDACDDPKNAWADVRVVPGKHGPWMCGVVRPHVSEDDAATYVARASRTSGHWKGGLLRMIVSCSVPAFPIDGVGNEPGEPDELVASFDPPAASGWLTIPKELLSLDELTGDAQQRVLDWALQGNQTIATTSGGTFTSGQLTTIDIASPSGAAPVEGEDEALSVERRRRERELALLLEDA